MELFGLMVCSVCLGGWALLLLLCLVSCCLWVIWACGFVLVLVRGLLLCILLVLVVVLTDCAVGL